MAPPRGRLAAGATSVNVDGLRADLEVLCASGAAEAPPVLADQLRSVSARLGGPLLVAIAGRVNAGKSTIVNALVGQRVAPTDVSECTQVVATFRYGAPQRIEAHLTSGEVVPARLGPDGLLPRELPAPTEQVARLDVWLSNERLRSVTLVDTPGLGSLNQERSQAAEAFLGLDEPSRHALGGAEALVFVLTQTVRTDERAALNAFHALADEAGCSAVNAIGVLNKADQVGAVDDPLAAAATLAARHASQLRAGLADIVPLVGLWAETAACGMLTDDDVATLAALATLEPPLQRRLMASAASFSSIDVPGIGERERRRLMERLGPYGIRRSVGWCGDGVTGAAAMVSALRDHSGAEALERSMEEILVRHRHALKVSSALDAVEAIAWDRAAPAPLRTRLLAGCEAVRLHPAAHGLAEMEVAADLRSERVTLPSPLSSQAVDVVGGGEALAAMLGERVGVVRRWRAFANGGASPAQARVARVVIRSLELAGDGIGAEVHGAGP